MELGSGILHCRLCSHFSTPESVVVWNKNVIGLYLQDLPVFEFVFESVVWNKNATGLYLQDLPVSLLMLCKMYSLIVARLVHTLHNKAHVT